MENSDLWKIIKQYFQDNPQCLVRHHIDSYNDFYAKDIYQIFKDNNPVKLQVGYDKETDTYKQECLIYLGGKDASKIYFGKPVIYDEDSSHYMFPNEARLRNMNYGMTIHYDVDIEFVDILESGEEPAIVGGDSVYVSSKEPYQHGGFVEQEGGAKKDDKEQDKKEETEEDKEKGKKKRPKKREKILTEEISAEDSAKIKEQTEKSVNGNIQLRTLTLEKQYLGRFPIMVQSDHCILSGLPRDMRHNMGECKNDLGGYFIIDGKEKAVVPQEKFGDNMFYIKKSTDETYLYSAEIRSVSENIAKPVRTLSVKLQAPNDCYTNKNIVVNIPNVRKPVPLFIVFRALGILSDKEIVETCLLSREKYSNLEELLVPSVYDAGTIFTQQTAIEYIRLLTKGRTVAHVLHILSDFFLPHIGETNFQEKAYYLGYIVFKLLLVYNGNEEVTDRDNYKFKRVELTGTMMSELFREYYRKQLKTIHLEFEKKVTYSFGVYNEDLYDLVRQNYPVVFGIRTVEQGFKKAFKGDWGSESHTKRIGVVQDLNRLSFNSMLSHLRKTNLSLDATAKVVGPRLLNSTQWGMFDPIDTPDGGNIGLHKHLAIMTHITPSYSREKLISFLTKHFTIFTLENYKPLWLANHSKIFVNGYWIGCVEDPFDMVEKAKLYRRNGLIPIYTSISFDIQENIVYFYTDGGRVCRPIFYKDANNKMSFEHTELKKMLSNNKLSWTDLIYGFNKRINTIDTREHKFYEVSDLYELSVEEVKDNEGDLLSIPRFHRNKSVIEYIDSNETEQALIAMNKEDMEKHTTKKFTHMEIHESLIFGMMCNLINFPENNPATRNSFSCGQSKQACSLYHTNHTMRMDKTAVVLNYGQSPIVKSRYLDLINKEENPYGENTIVAIMCYTGYNVEDAILVNEGALKRGLFRTTYYSTYEEHEEKSKEHSRDNVQMVQKKFVNIEQQSNVVGTKTGYDYSELDQYGLIKEGTEINDKTVLIGMVSQESDTAEKVVDQSKTTKKGQLGIVDKTFITDNEEGKRIAKVRIREQRIPAIGDKMASRAGQKGTIGLVVPECDMPFTKDGIRPDLIVNPHALPSRQTIGHLVECLIGKASAVVGGYGDCTAFNNKGSKVKVFGETLCQLGYHSSGNEILYNGMDGTQIESEIFMGPNYYMRLKHMVKDKINYRSQGPRTMLTRQAVSGRANDGGLRIGEMERDSVISHGTTEFLKESMMERGDKYYIAVCNKTGMMSVYNPEKNILMSPMADGPIQYVGSLDSEELHIQQLSKFGRDFSLLCVPYTFKLLLQELQTINVQMRLITDDNIDQIEHMTFSKNIQKLMHMPTSDNREVIRRIQREINNKLGPRQPMISTLNVQQQSDTSLETSGPETPETPPPPPGPETPETPPPPPGPETPETPPPPSGPVTPETPPPPSGPVTPETPPLPSGPVTPETPPLPSGPVTPETPPLPPRGALGEQVDEFPIGTRVNYLRDSNPNRIWNVTNVTGKWLTIKTDQPSNDGSDTTEVVTVMDIKKPESTPMSGGGMNGGGINFAPVITITNGGTEPNTTMTGGAEPITTITGDSTHSNPTIKEEEKTGGGILDFANMLVKKVT